MDEELLAALRHRAVDAHMSLSAWITATLESLVPRENEVEAARLRAIARMQNGFHLGGKPLSREETHVR
jgi:hypothetical protein